MGDKIAIIDLGTNTFHLLLAHRSQGQYKTIHQEKVPVKIGLGGINNNIITEAAITRSIEAMRNFKLILSVHKIDKVYAFGTSALRNAINGKEVAAQIETETGICIDIISGDEEANYIYQGVRTAVNMTEPSLIVDIGGGSVEFIIGNNDTIFWKQSFEIGAQRLLERFQKHDPITMDELAELQNYFDNQLGKLFIAIGQYPIKTLVGSSGTFDTLSDIYRMQLGFSPETTPETTLTLDAFDEIYQVLLKKNRAERLLIPGMIEMRVDMIVVACCLIQFLLMRLAVQKIRVSSYSLKEGVLAALNAI